MAVAAATTGVRRLGSAVVNWYLVEDEGKFTVVDAGVPAYRAQLEEALRVAGASVGDVEAVVLTHPHVDHVGFAEMLRAEAGVPVWVHAADEELARSLKPRGKNERSMLPYLRYPAVYRLLWEGVRGGGWKPRPIAEVRTYGDGEVLDVPGRPRVIHTPGHTEGHSALLFERAGALLAGDAICTYNPLTGARGPQVLPAAFAKSSAQQLESLSRIEDVDAVLLPGHGDPWTDGVRAAVERAREVGRT